MTDQPEKIFAAIRFCPLKVAKKFPNPVETCVIYETVVFPFLYKNLFYKNVEANTHTDVKNMLRRYPTLD